MGGPNWEFQIAAKLIIFIYQALEANSLIMLQKELRPLVLWFMRYNSREFGPLKRKNSSCGASAKITANSSKKGASSARSDNTKSLKGVILD